ncbi:unnamed protein product [Sphagnum tenellum]
MTTTQISKIQLRRGLQADLPGANTVGLDIGEVAFTTDTNRLFIGTDPSTSSSVDLIHNANTPGGFPFSNVEILTEFSPANQTIFNNEARNIIGAFIVSSPMAITGTNAWAVLNIQQPSGTGGAISILPFVINAQSNTGQFGTAFISYHVIDTLTGVPLRTGRMTVFYQGSAFPPSLVDDAICNPYSGMQTGGSPVDPNATYGMIAFQTVPAALGLSIQYQINMSGSNLPIPVMYFRVEQPFTS